MERINGCEPVLLLALLSDSLTKYVLENLHLHWTSIRIGVETWLTEKVSGLLPLYSLFLLITY